MQQTYWSIKEQANVNNKRAISEQEPFSGEKDYFLIKL